MKIIGFGILALLITAVAGGLWSFLLLLNLRASPNLPWAVAVMAVVLWALWQYLGGRWRPRKSAAARARALRANVLPAKAFALAIFAGLCAIVALAGFWIVLSQLYAVPAHRLPDFSKYPLATVVLILLMAPLVNAIAEEAGFRGYFQGALEERFNGPIAIIITALVMMPAHSLTQGFVWQVVLFYLLVDLMLGSLAHLTNSILPGIVVHAAGLLLFFAVIWPRDPARLSVWQGGANLWFWLHVAQIVIFGIVAVAVLRRLAGVSGRALQIEE